MIRIVSIIIPVYNVQEYVDRCISSILNQTYSSIEVILIDDGSTDESYEKCKAWAKKDKRILLLHQSNKGVSTARNLGISRATGHYITFVDSDDAMEKDAIETYVKIMEQNSGQLLFTEYRTNNGTITGEDCSNEEKEIDREKAIEYLIHPRGFHGAVWSKLFLKSIIIDNGLSFESDIRFCEDLLFTYEYLKCIEKVYYAPIKKYIYSVREGSTMRQSVSSLEDKRLDIVLVFNRIVEAGKGTAYYRRAVSRLVYQSCKIIPSFVQFQGGETEIKKLRDNVWTYTFLFLFDGTYPVSQRIKAIMKMLFPRMSFRYLSAKGKF